MQCTHENKLFCTICNCKIQSCEKCYCRLDGMRLLRRVAQKLGRPTETEYMKEMEDRMTCTHFNTCRNCNCRIAVRLVKNPFRVVDGLDCGNIPFFDLCETCSHLCFRCGTPDCYHQTGQFPIQYGSLITLRNLYSCMICDLSWWEENNDISDEKMDVGEDTFFAMSQLGTDLDIH